MPHLASLLLFLVVACGILAAMHYYVWLRLIREQTLAERPRKLLTVILVAFGAALPLAMAFGPRLPRSLSEWLLLPVFTWLGTLFLLVVALGLVDLARVLAEHGYRLWARRPFDPERRQTLARLTSLLAAVTGFGAAAAALRYRPVVKQLEVELERLPAAMDGTVIVQLSDIHVGPTIGREFVQSIVEEVNRLAPDLVAITGDLVDGDVERLARQVAPLAELSSRFGSFFVTGNHEYYSGAPQWCEHLTSLGIRVLRNERVFIGDGESGFELAGVDDYEAARFGDGHACDLDAALEGCHPERDVVLLAHQPRVLHQARRRSVALQLSGHTHGGQLWPFNWLVRLQQPVVAGLRRFGATQIYVHRGTGYWGPPMRLAAEAEIARIVLRSRQLRG